jgi:hypothetical protein
MTHHAGLRQLQVLMNGYVNRLTSEIRKKLMRTDMIVQTLPVKTFTKSLRVVEYPYSANTNSYRMITTQKLRSHVYGGGGFMLRGYTNLSDDGIVIEVNCYIGTHMYGPVSTYKSMARSTENAGDSVITAIEVYAAATNAKNSAFTSKDINLPKPTSVSLQPGESIVWDDTLCMQQFMIKKQSGVDLDATVRLVEFGWRIAPVQSKSFHQLFKNADLFERMSLPIDSLYGVKVVAALPPTHSASELRDNNKVGKLKKHKLWLESFVRVDPFVAGSQLSLSRLQTELSDVCVHPSVFYPPYTDNELSDRNGCNELSSYSTVNDYATDATKLLTSV